MTTRNEPHSALTEAPQHEVDIGGQTPLHWATRSKGPDDVKLLLDSGAFIDSQDDEGLTPLMVAIRYGKSENCETLLARGANLQLRALNGDPPLHFACRKKDISTAKLLLRYGADMEAITSNGGTTLSAAASLGKKEFVKFLLRNGANVESKLVDGMTPLHCACGSGQKTIVRSLIAYGADADVTDDCGRTPLWHATRGGDLRIVKILLETTTSNINAQVYNGPTALSTAARHSHNSIVKVLLKAGAEISPQEPGPHVPFLDPNKRLKDYGLDALVEAFGQKRQRVCRTILKAGAKTDAGKYARWLLVWDRGGLEEMRTLVAWVNVRQELYHTPELEALRKAMIKKVRELDQEKRRKVAEEIGVPYFDPNFAWRAQSDAELGINLEYDSERESEVESGEE